MPTKDDTDGEGILNKDDAFPNDPTEWKDTDNDTIGDNADTDRDGDNYTNDQDSHPDDPTKFDQHDTDGDGVQDKEDAFPADASETKDSDLDSVGDNKDPYPHDGNCFQDGQPCPFNKAEKPLPEQGFDEHSPKKQVEHDSMHTWTGDWREEWPAYSETEQESLMRICADNPDNSWCQKYLNRH